MAGKLLNFHTVPQQPTLLYLMAADQLKVVGQGGNMAVSAPELRLTNEVPFPHAGLTSYLCSRMAFLRAALHQSYHFVLLYLETLPSCSVLQNNNK